MKPEDLQKAPKMFAENIKIGHTPEFFVVAVSSGTQAQTYALSPGHAKRLSQYLEHEIKNFEEKNGEITAEWNPNVVSPIQQQQPPSKES